MSDRDPVLPANRPVAVGVLDEAIAWQLRLGSGETTRVDRREFEQWLVAHPDHRRAWRQLGVIDAQLHPAREPLSRTALLKTQVRLHYRSKRSGVLFGAVMVTAVSMAMLDNYQPIDHWLADYATAAGQRRQIELPDHSSITLNTRSAVDIAFDADHRAIRLLDGEILVETAHETDESRPFVVLTSAGSLRALGTRFLVRREGDTTLVTVLESAVDARPAACADAPAGECDTGSVIKQGESARLRADGVEDRRPAALTADAWTDGMLVVEDRRLAEVVAEIARYRIGHLAVDSRVADLRVTGTFPLSDTDLALTALARGLPVQMVRATALWVTVEPRLQP